jgi:SM-20-related protein
MTMAPPYLVVRDFLDQETVAGLLDYALRHETDFAPTSLGRGTINPAKRISVGVRDLGPFKPAFKSKMLERLPDFIAWLHATAVADAKLEFELVAHGDGAFYKRHIDTQTAADLQSIRFLSAVYYFHAEPKAFTGGALRLYAVGSAAAEHVDIEPACNTLVVFPSWIPHEVMPVRCPSKRFSDSRFAINGWFHGSRPRGAAGENTT